MKYLFDELLPHKKIRSDDSIDLIELINILLLKVWCELF